MALNGNNKMTNCLSEHNACRGACVPDKFTAEPIQNVLCASVLDRTIHTKTLRALQVEVEALRADVATTKNAYGTLWQRMDALCLRKSSTLMDALDVATKFDTDTVFTKGNQCLHAGVEFFKSDKIIQARQSFLRANYIFQNIQRVNDEQKSTLHSKRAQVFRKIALCMHLQVYTKTNLDNGPKLLNRALDFYKLSLKYYESAENDGMVQELHNVMRRCSEGNG